MQLVAPALAFSARCGVIRGQRSVTRSAPLLQLACQPLDGSKPPQAQAHSRKQHTTAGLRMQEAAGSPQGIHAHASLAADLHRFSASLSKENHERITLASVVDSQQQEAADNSSFKLNSFFAQLHSQRLGKVVLYNETLPSTQTLLFRELSLQEDGVICLADRQSSGKGRGKNVWISPEGCLTFSFTSHVRQPSLVPFFQYIVSMAMHRAVSHIIGGDAKRLIGLELKWPNDIYGPNRTKMGGVLCESTMRVGSPLFHVVAGVGINVLNSAPTTSLRALMEGAGLADAAASLSREALLAAFCPQMEVLLSTLESQGFEALSEEYTRQWMHSGQRVKVQAEDGSEVREAIISGIARSGYLLAIDNQGREEELHPDGNSLDMMQGLIYQKK